MDWWCNMSPFRWSVWASEKVVRSKWAVSSLKPQAAETSGPQSGTCPPPVVPQGTAMRDHVVFPTFPHGTFIYSMRSTVYYFPLMFTTLEVCLLCFTKTRCTAAAISTAEKCDSGFKGSSERWVSHQALKTWLWLHRLSYWLKTILKKIKKLKII